MTSKIKFGLALQNYVAPGESVSPKTLINHAVRAEELGYSSIWVWDHILLGAKSVFPVHDSLTILTAVATETEHVRLGTGILVLSIRNPVVLAKQVATLDNLSNGRVTLGIAAGWYEREFQACGYPYETGKNPSDEHADFEASLDRKQREWNLRTIHLQERNNGAKACPKTPPTDLDGWVHKPSPRSSGKTSGRLDLILLHTRKLREELEESTPRS